MTPRRLREVPGGTEENPLVRMLPQRLAVAALLAVNGTLGCARQDVPASPPPPTAGPSAAAAAVPVATGRISGRVRYEGPVPAPRALNMSPECRDMSPEGLMFEPIRARDGVLADAVVYVKTAVSGTHPPPTEAVVLDQKSCRYVPVSVAVQTGQPLLLKNSDATFHNVHLRPNSNREINTGQPPGMQKPETLEEEETLIPVGCDVHPWMRAYVSVFSHPFFAISGEDGAYEIGNLPAGEYEMKAVHPRLQPVTGKLTVKAGGTATLDLAFKG